MKHLKYLKRGHDKNYPKMFVLISDEEIKRFQTTEKSTNGTPRYSVNPNSDATYTLKECMSNNAFRPVY